MSRHGKPRYRSVEELQRDYERGEGFARAVREAQRLLAAGTPEAEILEAIGFYPTNQRILEKARGDLGASTLSHQADTADKAPEHPRAAA